MAQTIFVARRARGRMLVLLAALVLASLFALFLAGELPDIAPDLGPRWRVLLYVVVGLGLLVALLRLPALLSSPEEIRIGPDGIWCRSWSDETVPWGAIAHVAERRMNVQRIVCVYLNDPAAFRVKAVARLSSGLNKAAEGFGDMNLVTMQTDRTHADLVDAIRVYRRF